jgi:hypothetical protein
MINENTTKVIKFVPSKRVYNLWKKSDLNMSLKEYARTDIGITNGGKTWLKNKKEAACMPRCGNSKAHKNWGGPKVGKRDGGGGKRKK